MSDYYNIIDTAVEAAEKRAFTKGREEGRAEGREEGRAEAIVMLLSAGFDEETVVKALGVSDEELQRAKRY